MSLIPLNVAQHGRLRLRPLTSFLFAAPAPVASLYGAEVMRAAHEFPIGFTAEAEGYFPAALLGLEPDQNLFVDADGRWLSGYVPAVWRRGAFRLAKLAADGDPDRRILCVDTDSPLLNDSDGQPLFDADGQPTGVVEQARQFLTELERNRLATLAACAQLDRLGLIVPWELKVDDPTGARKTLVGLSRIDEGKFAGLDAEALLRLRDLGALALIYGHLLSLHRLALLGGLARQRAEANSKLAALQQGKLDLDRLFGIVEEDPFIF